MHNWCVGALECINPKYINNSPEFMKREGERRRGGGRGAEEGEGQEGEGRRGEGEEKGREGDLLRVNMSLQVNGEHLLSSLSLFSQYLITYSLFR